MTATDRNRLSALRPDFAATALYERLWDVITEARDAGPRQPDDVATDDLVVAALPVIVAELRRIADEPDAARLLKAYADAIAATGYA